MAFSCTDGPSSSFLIDGCQECLMYVLSGNCLSSALSTTTGAMQETCCIYAIYRKAEKDYTILHLVQSDSDRYIYE